MAHAPLFDAGVSFGRGHILALIGSSHSAYHLRRAGQYLRQAGEPTLANHATNAARNPTFAVVDSALYAVQRGLSGSGQHAYNAGVNLGWAIETCAGQQAEDVHKVVDALQKLAAHAKVVAANDRQVDHVVNRELNPIRNLVNASHPKPRELPQYKPRLERMQATMRNLIR